MKGLGGGESGADDFLTNLLLDPVADIGGQHYRGLANQNPDGTSYLEGLNGNGLAWSDYLQGRSATPDGFLWSNVFVWSGGLLWSDGFL